MIENGTFVLPGKPWIVGKHRAVAPCGCRVWMGLRVDTQEAATTAESCSDGHSGLVERFNEQLRASLENPSDRPLIDVIDDILLKVYQEEEKCLDA